MKYTNKFINLISLILSILIFSIIYFLFFYRNNSIERIHNLAADIGIINDNEHVKNNIQEKEKDNNNVENNQNSVELGDWYIEIPVINLIAPISEGIDTNTLNTKVGHFPDTAIDNGNVGLAAHNRGYEYNYFQNLKKLKMDDQIIYNYKNIKKTYIVNKIEIIENSNWECLKKSDENKITLITCVENEPNYRRCVQAIEL